MYPLRKLLWLFLFTSPLWPQAKPAISTGVVAYALPFSAYGYPQTLLPGSQRTMAIGYWCANLQATAYSTDNTGTVITANNNLSVGDQVQGLGFMDGPMAFHLGVTYTVTAATATNFKIGLTDENPQSGTTTTATIRKTGGAGCTSRVKWEIIDTGSTAETYRLMSIDGTQDTGMVSHPIISSTIPVVRIQIGPIEGVTSRTGAISTGDFALHSTVSLTLKATSLDDPTQFATYNMIVTHNGGGYPGLQGKAFSNPGFRTVYKNRDIPLVSQVLGNVNQMVNWTIVSAPVGGDATILFPTYPHAVFRSGTVDGNYRVKVCPAVDSSAAACAYDTIAVGYEAAPSTNPDKVELAPCPTTAGPTVLGVTWGTIYDIGKTGSGTPDLLSIPQNPVGPVLVRLWNNGAAGAPTEYHNQTQINPPSGGPFSDQRPAFFMCSVKASNGELAVVDGADATANSWASQYVVGPYSIFGIAGGSGGSALPTADPFDFNTVTIQNIHFRHVTQGYFYYSVVDGTRQPWGESSGPRPSNSIQNFNLIGNRIEDVSDGIFDDCNAQNQGMNHCTMDTFDEGNHLSGYGYPGDFLAHPYYKQAMRTYSMLNLLDGAIPGSQGTAWFSDRGTRSFHMYNRFVTNDPTAQGSVVAGHSENQDAHNILNLDSFWGYQGSSTCDVADSTAIGCLPGWVLDPVAWQAAIVEEHNRTDYMIGNAISVPNVYKSFGVAMTHSWFSYQPYGVGGWNREWSPENLSQNLWFAYNTVQYGAPSVAAGGLALIEDVRLNFSDAGESITYLLQPQYYPEIWMTNNLIPLDKQVGCDYACNVLNISAHQLTHFQTNMFGGITTPAGPFNSNTGAYATNGWNLNPAVSDWGSIDPITDHLSGWTTSNFLNYSTFPINATSLVPIPGSAAIGKATTLTGDVSAYPPRFNAVDANMSPFTLRQQPTTLGAYDSGAQPPAPPTNFGVGRIFGSGVFR